MKTACKDLLSPLSISGLKIPPTKRSITSSYLAGSKTPLMEVSLYHYMDKKQSLYSNGAKLGKTKQIEILRKG